MMPTMSVFNNFDRSSLRVDFRALAYLERSETNIVDQQRILTRGDGNCLFNSLSICICGNDSLNEEIRARTCVEMATYQEYYVQQPYSKDFVFVCDSFEQSMVNCAQLGAYSDAWNIQAASGALNREITSLYPTVNHKQDYIADLLTRSFEPKDHVEELEPLHIMWTLIGHHIPGTPWLPNHFVPLISVFEENENKLSTPNQSSIETVLIIPSKECSYIEPEPHIVDRSETRTSLDISESAEQNVLPTSEQNTSFNNSDGEAESKTNIPGLNPLPENGKVLTIDELFDILASEEPCVDSVPRGVKENVFILFNNSDNMSKRESKKAPQFWDDCGTWDSKKARNVKSTFLLTHEESKPHGLNYVVVKDGIVYKEIRTKGKKEVSMLEPQPPLSRIVTVHRHYMALKRDNTYKKRVSWVECVPSDFNCRNNIAVIEYVGNYSTSEIPHGNSKINTQGYVRTHPDVIKKIKANVVHQKPTDTYTQLTNPTLDDSFNFPRDLKQCQNVKAKTANEGNKGHKSQNIADEIMNVIHQLNDNHPFVAEMIHSRESNLPIIICYTDEQLEDFKSFLSTKSGVVGVDRTFSLGKCFVTTTVYKSRKINRKGTGEPPILLGPLMLHWDGRQKNYFRFFSHIRGVLGLELNNIELLMGTDDERAMTNAIDMAMPGVKRKLCTKHIKDNIIRQTTDKIPKTTKERKEIVDLIFSSEGVATANDSAVFDERNQLLKEKSASTLYRVICIYTIQGGVYLHSTGWSVPTPYRIICTYTLQGDLHLHHTG